MVPGQNNDADGTAGDFIDHFSKCGIGSRFFVKVENHGGRLVRKLQYFGSKVGSWLAMRTTTVQLET